MSSNDDAAEAKSDVKAAVNDQAYQALLDAALEVTRRYARHQLEWYHEVGGIFDKFVIARDSRKLGKRTIQQFLEDLAQDCPGLTLGESTLFLARAIFKSYRFDRIQAMVASGMRIGHVKALMPYHEDQRAMNLLHKQMTMPDGSVVPVEKLLSIINEFKRTQPVKLGEPAKDDATPAEEAPTKARGADTYVASDTDDEFFEESAGEAAPSTEEPEAPAKPEDGKTASRGLTESKEFTCKPLVLLKGFDNKISTFISNIIPKVTIAVCEGPKVGFDNPVARENYKRDLSNAMAAAIQLVNTLGPLVEEMRRSLESV